MGAVNIYCRDRTLGADLAGRGHHVVYRAEETNRCPGCGRAQWHVGRQTAECAFCGTAIALAEAKWVGAGKAAASPLPDRDAKPDRADKDGPWANRRRHKRAPVVDRTLKLLIDGSPHEFAIHNLSAGGVMGAAPDRLKEGDTVQVRFEGGIIVPATVKWSSDELVGLAFDSPVLFDAARSD
jgi:ribosomal protein L37E